MYCFSSLTFGRHGFVSIDFVKVPPVAVSEILARWSVISNICSSGALLPSVEALTVTLALPCCISLLIMRSETLSVIAFTGSICWGVCEG